MTVEVSVVTSVRNGEPYLTASLESLAAQTGVEAEFIVIDDGSTDGSEEILDRFAARDPRFRVHHRPAAGLTAALREGCALARGSFIARHDADDLSLPGRLAAQLGLLRSDPSLAFVGCGVRMIGPEEETLSETVHRRPPAEATRGLLAGREGPAHGSVIFRTEAYEKVGGYRPEFRHAQDVDLWLRLAETGTFACVPDVLYAFRVTERTFRPGYHRKQKRLARLAHQGHQRRARGLPETAVLETARRISALPRSGSISRAPGAYFIARCLQRNGDPRARAYLREASRSPWWFLRALLAVSRDSLRGASRRRAGDRAISPAGDDRSSALFVCDAQRSPSIGMGGSQYRTIRALEELGIAVASVWESDLPHCIRHPNLHHLLEQPRAYRRAIRRRTAARDYAMIVASQPQCFLAAKDHRRSGRPGVFLHRSHGLEQRVNDVVGLWRARWKEPAQRFPKSLLSAAMRRLLDRQSERAARFCDGTIVFSALDRDYLVRHAGVDPERVAVIPAGAPPGFLQTPPPPPDAERRHRILYAGQLAFFKAPGVAAEAFRSLAEAFPACALTWVCDPRDHAKVADLLGRAAGRCRLLAWMNQSELRDVYDAHGIFVFPSLFEGSGKSCLEAMARGLAVITTDEGGMRDFIRDGESGFLVPPGEAAPVVARAQALIRDPQAWLRVSAAARETAERYTWERNARETVAFAERLSRLSPGHSNAGRAR